MGVTSLLSRDQAESGKWKVESKARWLRSVAALVPLMLICIALTASAFAQPVSVSKESLYSVDASGTDIKFVLEALARQSGANVVVSPDVSGTITAHLKQMSMESLLECLAAAHGFEWSKRGETYLISAKDANAKTEVTPPPPAPEPEALVWRCRHVRAADLVNTLSNVFPGCKVAVGPSSVTPKLQDPLSGASAAIGVATSGSGASSTSSGSSQDNATTIILYGDAKEIDRAKTLLEKIDVARSQIAIEVAVIEIGSELTKELGISWSWNDITLKEAAGSGIKFGNITKQPMTFTGALAALTSDGRSHLLAQPNISVLDGACADILIGDRILFPKLVGYNQFGTPIYDKDEERVGIYLQIAPRVTGDDEVVLTLYPQVSLVTKYLKTQAGDYPQISTREARTTVRVKSGATLAIGGLIKDDDIRSAEKIPLLGDLPILGQFFRHNTTTKNRTEIVIFLTPKIVPPGT